MSEKDNVKATLGKHKRRKGWKFWTILIGGIGFAGFIGVSALSGGPAVTEYERAEVTQGDLVVQVSATGTIQPVNQIQVGAEISGMIEEVLVDFNDQVTAGQVLARLNTEELDAAAVQAEAAHASAVATLAEARASASEARAQRNRTRALVERNNASEAQLEIHQAAYARTAAGVERSEANVVQAQAALDSARSRLDKAEIRSPINGIVLDRLIEEGQTVAASFQTPHLFTIAQDLTQMELQVSVDEADIGYVYEGQSALFTVDAYPAREFGAVIAQVRNAPRELSGVVTYEALLLVDNPDQALKPGMTAAADITVDTIENAMLVPNGALRFSPPDQDDIERPAPVDGVQHGLIWTQGDDGELEHMEVAIGETDGRLTVLLDGVLEAGQEVITDIARNRNNR
jgi:HlyD family secretion protein